MVISPIVAIAAMTTTIEIRDDQWKKLNALKEPGESFKDVIDRLLTADAT